MNADRRTFRSAEPPQRCAARSLETAGDGRTDGEIPPATMSNAELRGISEQLANNVCALLTRDDLHDL